MRSMYGGLLLRGAGNDRQKRNGRGCDGRSKKGQTFL